MPAMLCPPLCPQRVRSPSKQEAGISQARTLALGVPTAGEERGGSTAGAAAAHGPVPPCSQPSAGSYGGLPGRSPPRDPCCRAGCLLTSLKDHFFCHLVNRGKAQ